ncbi:oxidoreductase [Nocardioides insulae]|uniref:oxidoreductase n=1 Tax=Nocardioides insulae TaxID=394734 RepID=UPI00048B5DB7|nr:oxidoreductase [Nocardioides insulae]
MRTDPWTTADLEDQSGRQVLVTGTTVGSLGHQVALELARRQARVILAGRSSTKLEDTAAAITAQVPDADLLMLTVDLASLASVRRAADRAVEFGPIDVLVNNAGLMAPPGHPRSVDGFDLQLATNHLGPFLLTGLLLPQLELSQDGRVVMVSSDLHRFARRAPLGDPTQPPRVSPWRAYAASKLANLLFTYELERRLRLAGRAVRATAAHPGVARTALVSNGPASRLIGTFTAALGQSAEQGAWPILMAAAARLPGGTFCGPSGSGGRHGPAVVARSSRLSHDRHAQLRLWEISESATGLSYP